MTDTETAPAKVNLFLRVVGRRPDGYHLLDSVAVFAGIADRLSVTPTDRLSLHVTGPFAAALANETENLVLRAARNLAREAGVQPAGALVLDKRIPVASGIGGGSADAAAALRLLQRHWRLPLDAPRLEPIAAQLGADVPICLRSQPARMHGVGELLSLAPAMPSGLGLMLVNPGVPLTTATVFKERSGSFSQPANLPERWQTARELAASLVALSNDLEEPAIRLVPAIRDVLGAIARVQGCLVARMSGSGATCFGVFADAAEAMAAAAALTRPGWWTWGGALAVA